MNLFSHRPRDPESAALRARIFNVLPAASYQMEKLLGLLDIAFSDATRTACVECRITPRLLLNRAFVDEHCRADGDLFLLIMHELYHVMLGHTRLFERITPLDNLVFDAVINAMLCRQFHASVGTGLFKRLYSWKKFPHRLLRPPTGWPHSISAALKEVPLGERRVVEFLYGREANDSVTYFDIYQLLQKELPKVKWVDGIVLLGSHGDDARAEDAAVLKQVIRRIVEGWPPPPFRICGRDDGVKADPYQLAPRGNPRREFLAALKRLLVKCGVRPLPGAGPRRMQRVSVARQIETVLPQPRDRRIPALTKLFGRPPVFYRDESVEVRPRLELVPQAHVYLDVSGSMDACLPLISVALAEPFRRQQVKLFAFSTVVSEVTAPRLAEATFKNTLGTDINCVLEHLAGLPARQRPTRALILTDGYVGAPLAHLLEQLERIKLYAGITGRGSLTDLQAFMTAIVQLPPLS